MIKYQNEKELLLQKEIGSGLRFLFPSFIGRWAILKEKNNKILFFFLRKKKVKKLCRIIYKVSKNILFSSQLTNTCSSSQPSQLTTTCSSPQPQLIRREQLRRKRRIFDNQRDEETQKIWTMILHGNLLPLLKICLSFFE